MNTTHHHQQLLLLSLKYLSNSDKHNYTNLYKALDIINRYRWRNKKMDTKGKKKGKKKEKIKKIKKKEKIKKIKKHKPIPRVLSDIPGDIIIHKILPLLQIKDLFNIRELNETYKNIVDHFFQWDYYFYYKYVKEFKKYFEKEFRVNFWSGVKLVHSSLLKVYPKTFKGRKNDWRFNFITFYEKLLEFKDIVDIKDGDELYVFHLLKYNAHFLGEIKTDNEKFLKKAYLIAIESTKDPKTQIMDLYDIFDFHLQHQTELMNDFDIAMALMKENPWLYLDLGKDVQENRKVILEAIKSDGRILSQIKQKHPRYLKDPQILIKAIKSSPHALEHCPLKYKENIEFVSIAIAKDGASIKHLPVEFYVKNYSKEQLKDLFLLAENNTIIYVLKYAKEFLKLIQDEEFIYEMVESLIKKSLVLNHKETINELARIYVEGKDEGVFFRIFNEVLSDLKIDEEVDLRIIKIMR